MRLLLFPTLGMMERSGLMMTIPSEQIDAVREAVRGITQWFTRWY